MSQGHHLDDALAEAVAEGRLPEIPSREELESHLAACPECRRLVLAVCAGLEAPPSLRAARFPRLRYAAAAMLLAAGAGAWMATRPPRLPAEAGGGARTAATSPSPGRILAGSDAVRALLSRELAAELSPEARLVRAQGGWALEAGAIWCGHEGGGAPLRADGCEIACPGPASFGVRIFREASSCSGLSFLARDAWAGEEPAVEIWVEQGEVVVREGGREIVLSAGCRWIRGGESRPAAAEELASAFAWREPGRADAPGEARSFTAPGALLLSAPEGPYLVSFRIRASGAAASAGVSCQVGGETAVWELPAALWNGTEHLVVLEVSGVGARVQVDGRTMRFVDRGAFRSNALGDRPGAGVVVWGGAFAVSRAALKPLGRGDHGTP